jgi:hypothetical protein
VSIPSGRQDHLLSVEYALRAPAGYFLREAGGCLRIEVI